MDRGWIIQFTSTNLVKQTFPILTIKGREARQHFVQESAQTPPIDGTTVTLSIQNFRGQVFRCSTKTIGSADTVTDALLGQAKIREPNVSLVVQQDIFWFQIPIDNIQTMNIGNSQHNLCRIESGSGFGKPSQSAQMVKEFATRTIIQHKVQFILGLEGHVHSHNKWMLHIAQYIPFGFGMFNLVALDDIVFPQYLESINFTRFDFPDQKHFSCNVFMREDSHKSNVSDDERIEEGNERDNASETSGGSCHKAICRDSYQTILFQLLLTF